MSFRDVKAGDKVTRLLAGSIPMELQVVSVDDRLIHCGPFGWTFCRDTGAEVDECLGWGAPPLQTGSFLVKDKK